jgi:DNA-binding NarL/FixJ family response regulator
MSTPTATQTIRVLMVDDNEGIRHLIRALARHDGVEVVAEAADGHDAIDEAGIHLPQVVLLDIDMPDLDGISAIPDILQASPASKIIMYSAYEHRQEEATTAGAHGWVTKGATWQEIKQTIVSTVEQTNGSRPVSP